MTAAHATLLDLETVRLLRLHAGELPPLPRLTSFLDMPASEFAAPR